MSRAGDVNAWVAHLRSLPVGSHEHHEEWMRLMRELQDDMRAQLARQEAVSR